MVIREEYIRLYKQDYGKDPIDDSSSENISVCDQVFEIFSFMNIC